MEQRNFLIVGLPRSRTAWLANFLSYGDTSLCLHDEFRHGPEHVTGVMNSYGLYNYVGISDSGGFVYPELVLKYRTVFITRSTYEVSNSLADVGLTTSGLVLRDWNSKLMSLAWNQPSSLTIGYYHINQRLEDIWNFCLPNIPFDRDRAELLTKLNVQVHNPLEYYKNEPSIL